MVNTGAERARAVDMGAAGAGAPVSAQPFSPNSAQPMAAINADRAIHGGVNAVRRYLKGDFCI
jgi:hypothetical protein